MAPAFPGDGSPQLKTADEIELHARRVMAEFLDATEIRQAAEVDALSLIRTSAPAAAAGAREERLVRAGIENGRASVSVDAGKLVGISEAALGGWLEFALMFSIHRRARELPEVNFKKQILPLMPVSGSAAYLLRELVEYLIVSLRNYRSTRELIGMGRGAQQVWFRGHLLIRRPEPREDYSATLCHDWIRALNLCKKARESVVLDLLAACDVAAAADLQHRWHERHKLLTDDVRLLGELFAVLHTRGDDDVGLQIVEMFRRVKAALLVRSRGQGVPDTVH